MKGFFSCSVKSSLHLMDVKRILSFDPTTAVCGSWQQPPSRRANPVQSNLPSHAKWSSVVWPQCANLHPRTNTEATGSDRSGIKIKPYEEDVVPRKRTAVPCSENNRGSCRKRSADPSTAGWISRTQTCVSSQVRRRGLMVNTHTLTPTIGGIVKGREQNIATALQAHPPRAADTIVRMPPIFSLIS